MGMTRVQYILAIMIVGAFILLSGILFIPGIQEKLPKWTQENMFAVFVAWVNNFGVVVNFFFGSSKGSLDKTEMLKPRNGR